jgi:hypothetical protein
MRWPTLLALSALFGCALSGGSHQRNEDGPWEVRVALVHYFPVDGDRIDIRKTGDWGETLAATREKCARMTRETIQALEQGSRFRGYKNPEARPSITYRVVKQFEFLEPLPTVALRPGEKVPMTDYNAIMARIGIRDLVEREGVKEVWIWGYHGGVLNLWESNMSSPFGDVSNSNRDEKDLPVLSRTYTVYHYNYQRDTGEAVEDHTHQIEALLNRVDGRDTTPPERWPELLFWGKFVGSDASHKIVTNPARCGWTHYAPNSERDYDWANPRYVETDIEDWTPDRPGPTKRLNCERWGCDGLKWKIFWMQSLPGMRNGLSYQGRPLRNWWLFKADWDLAMRGKMTLVR